MTMLEILIVVMLVGVVVPPLTSSLSRQSALRARNTARDVALIYAEEGVELMLNGGYRHWYDRARPRNPYFAAPTYTYNRTFPPPANNSDNITLTVSATGQTIDDPFCPFVGTQAATSGNLMLLRPWSQFRRQMEIVSYGGTAVPRYLNGTVRVYYGPDTANDVVTVPLWISNHHPVTQDTDADNALRGIVWMPSSITLSSINDVPVEPTCSAACQFPRKPWGKAPEATTRYLRDSSYPISAAVPGFGDLGFPP